MPEVPVRVPIATAELSVILLLHDGGGELEEVVHAWMNLLGELQRTFEVILVDDGSVAGGGAIADRLAEQFPPLQVMHHAASQGQGNALQTGLSAARFPLVFYTLANKQYQPPDLRQLLASIDQVDIVTGYRVWRPAPWWVRVWDFFFRWLCRIVFGLPLESRQTWLGQGIGRRMLARWVFGLQLQDPECPYRLLRREALRRVPIQSRGSFAHVEVLAKANFLGAWIAEAPISFVPGKTPQDESVADILKLLRSADFGPIHLPAEPQSPL